MGLGFVKASCVTVVAMGYTDHVCTYEAVSLVTIGTLQAKQVREKSTRDELRHCKNCGIDGVKRTNMDEIIGPRIADSQDHFPSVRALIWTDGLG
ncbi:hypothetical protein E4U43_004598 [Claviceps pusilla]|uniref:Uncharacterized protein n=1 Tax=Claviceps pusilla TaxID=123648 RepID=A0A9P7NEY5_9HYPO|nr:hypothetical protein E4U43_004598 [Claviceps pusilla]